MISAIYAPSPFLFSGSFLILTKEQSRSLNIKNKLVYAYLLARTLIVFSAALSV